jgi:hypothetical protein
LPSRIALSGFRFLAFQAVPACEGAFYFYFYFYSEEKVFTLEVPGFASMGEVH